MSTVLLILDGFGLAAQGEGNALCLAEAPNLNKLLAECPVCELACSGRAVGLPEGFMGNSEVGHMNIGAGRTVYQDMTRIDLAMEQDEFGANPVFQDVFAKVKAAGGVLHLLGLVSDGGVHSHINHIKALALAAKDAGVDVKVHAFLDGRDTPPKSGAGYVRELSDFLSANNAGRIASLTGRYYAMDRDKRWERNKIAWDGLVHGKGEVVDHPVSGVEIAYADGQTDEFVTPRLVMNGHGTVDTIGDNDGVIFFNFRADRARQLIRAFFDPDFAEFDREGAPKLSALASMTQYESTFPVPAAFPPQKITHTLGQMVSEAGKTQLRLAETEKYAHVTYFLNCGREEPFEGEERVLVESPRDVATYDLKPEMSAREVTDILLDKWAGKDLTVCNLANLDMVGHTGILDAAMKAVQVVDECVGRIIQAVEAGGGCLLVTADHGNAEEMIDDKGGAMTAHTLNPVPMVLACGGQAVALKAAGTLADIAPTILDLMGLEQPEDMTGTSLVKRGGEGE